MGGPQVKLCIVLLCTAVLLMTSMAVASTPAPKKESSKKSSSPSPPHRRAESPLSSGGRQVVPEDVQTLANALITASSGRPGQVEGLVDEAKSNKDAAFVLAKTFDALRQNSGSITGGAGEKDEQHRYPDSGTGDLNPTTRPAETPAPQPESNVIGGGSPRPSEAAPSSPSPPPDAISSSTRPPSDDETEATSTTGAPPIIVDQEHFEKLANAMRENADELVQSLRNNAGIVVQDFVRVAELLEKQIRDKSDSLLQSVQISADELQKDNEKLSGAVERIHASSRRTASKNPTSKLRTRISA